MIQKERCKVGNIQAGKRRGIQYICMYRSIAADRVIDAIRYYPRCKITHRDPIALSEATVLVCVKCLMRFKLA